MENLHNFLIVITTLAPLVSQSVFIVVVETDHVNYGPITCTTDPKIHAL
jgi:hypothetical protein